MPIGRPARRRTARGHDGESVSISQGELLVGVFLYESTGAGKFLSVERLDGQVRQLFQEKQELQGSVLIVPAQEPTVPFGDNQAGRY